VQKKKILKRILLSPTRRRSIDPLNPSPHQEAIAALVERGIGARHKGRVPAATCSFGLQPAEDWRRLVVASPRFDTREDAEAWARKQYGEHIKIEGPEDWPDFDEPEGEKFRIVEGGKTR